MKVERQVRETILKHNLIETGDHIVMGLSGGPDSLCLYNVLLALAEEMNLTIHPVHVNHRFRPGAAEKDQAFVEKLCAENAGRTPEIARPCRSFVVDCIAFAEETGMTSEEAGRKVRYDAFFQVAEEIEAGLKGAVADGKVADGVVADGIEQVEEAPDGRHAATGERNLREAACDEVPEERNSLEEGMSLDVTEKCKAACGSVPGIKIAVAQNANDQAETILFRILRGTGTDGLAGIAYVREEARAGKSYRIIRPLLDTWRKDIEAYCEAEQLAPVIDHTNSEEIYSRNRIRLDLLPYLKEKYNENIEAGLNRLGSIAAADKDYFRQETEKAFRKLRISGSESEVILDREGLASCHESIRHRVVQKAFGETGLTSDITAERLKGADAVICRKQGEKIVEFPHGYRLRVAKGLVHFEKTLL